MYINTLLFWEIMYVRVIEGGSPHTWLRLNEAREERERTIGDCLLSNFTFRLKRHGVVSRDTGRKGNVLLTVSRCIVLTFCRY